MRTRPRHDVIVLAGGSGARLGGVDKAGLVVAGTPLLERVLAGTDGADRCVVVGPGPVPHGVLLTREDPVGGGPVAAIAAGVAALARTDRAPWTLVLAVDQPAAALVVPEVLAACASLTDPDGAIRASAPDGVCPVDAEGHPQWLLAAYRSSALESQLASHGGGHGVSVGRLVSPMRLATVTVPTDHLGDVDTWQDLRHWEEHLDGD